MKILKNEYFIIYGILVLFLVYNFFNFYNSISVGVINHEGIPSKIISFINFLLYFIYFIYYLYYSLN